MDNGFGEAGGAFCAVGSKSVCILYFLVVGAAAHFYAVVHSISAASVVTAATVASAVDVAAAKPSQPPESPYTRRKKVIF